MPALLSIVAPQIIPPPISTDVQGMVNEMWDIARVHKTNMARLEYVGWRLRYALADDFTKIGYASEDVFREALGIGRSTYFMHLSIGAALCTLKLADLEAIPLENRKLLAHDVDPAIRDQYDWVTEAKRLSTEQFALKITQRNRARGSDKEPSGRVSIKVPITAKVFIENALEEYRIQNELPTIGEALEFMVADLHDRQEKDKPAPKPSTTPQEYAAIAHRAAKHVRVAMWWFRNVEKGAWMIKRMAVAHRLLMRIANKEGVVDAENAKAVYRPFYPQDLQDFTVWEAGLLEQSGRAAGEEAEGDDPVEAAGRDVRSMPDGDAADREYADLAGGQG